MDRRIDVYKQEVDDDDKQQYRRLMPIAIAVMALVQVRTPGSSALVCDIFCGRAPRRAISRRDRRRALHRLERLSPDVDLLVIASKWRKTLDDCPSYVCGGNTTRAEDGAGRNGRPQVRAALTQLGHDGGIRYGCQNLPNGGCVAATPGESMTTVTHGQRDHHGHGQPMRTCTTECFDDQPLAKAAIGWTKVVIGPVRRALATYTLRQRRAVVGS